MLKERVSENDGCDNNIILIGIDGSPDALRAVDHVGAQFKGIKNLRITLLHALPGLPPEFWDDGHILNEGERAERFSISLRVYRKNQKMGDIRPLSSAAAAVPR